jgi:hypothetical protein
MAQNTQYSKNINDVLQQIQEATNPMDIAVKPFTRGALKGGAGLLDLMYGVTSAPLRQRTTAPGFGGYLQHIMGPSYLSKGVENLPWNIPESKPAEYIESIGEFAVPGGVLGKAARAGPRVAAGIASGIGAQGVGDIAQSLAPELEPVGRLAGAFVAPSVAGTAYNRLKAIQDAKIPSQITPLQEGKIQGVLNRKQGMKIINQASDYFHGRANDYIGNLKTELNTMKDAGKNANLLKNEIFKDKFVTTEPLKQKLAVLFDKLQNLPEKNRAIIKSTSPSPGSIFDPIEGMYYYAPPESTKLPSILREKPLTDSAAAVKKAYRDLPKKWGAKGVDTFRDDLFHIMKNADKGAKGKTEQYSIVREFLTNIDPRLDDALTTTRLGIFADDVLKSLPVNKNPTLAARQIERKLSTLLQKNEDFPDEIKNIISSFAEQGKDIAALPTKKELLTKYGRMEAGSDDQLWKQILDMGTKVAKVPSLAAGALTGAGMNSKVAKLMKEFSPEKFVGYTDPYRMAGIEAATQMAQSPERNIQTESSPPQINKTKNVPVQAVENPYEEFDREIGLTLQNEDDIAIYDTENPYEEFDREIGLQ